MQSNAPFQVGLNVLLCGAQLNIEQEEAKYEPLLCQTIMACAQAVLNSLHHHLAVLAGQESATLARLSVTVWNLSEALKQLQFSVHLRGWLGQDTSQLRHLCASILKTPIEHAELHDSLKGLEATLSALDSKQRTSVFREGVDGIIEEIETHISDFSLDRTLPVSSFVALLFSHWILTVPQLIGQLLGTPGPIDISNRSIASALIHWYAGWRLLLYLDSEDCSLCFIRLRRHRRDEECEHVLSLLVQHNLQQPTLEGGVSNVEKWNEAVLPIAYNLVLSSLTKSERVRTIALSLQVHPR